MSARDGYDFRLNEVSQIRKYFEDEIENRKKFKKKYKICMTVNETVTGALNLLVITTGSVTIAAATSIIGAPIAVLSSLGLAGGILSGGATLIIKRKLVSKYSKHVKILLLAETFYSCINLYISRALSDQKIDQKEYELMVNEKRKYISAKASVQKKTDVASAELHTTEVELLKKQMEEIMLRLNLQNSTQPHLTKSA